MMDRRALLLVALCALSACGGGDGGGSSPTAPTPAPAPIPSGSAGTTLTQNGCAVTYACPNVDANGNANPATPTFDRLTLSNGTSSTCRFDMGPNVPDAQLPIEFTIRNPASGYLWGTPFVAPGAPSTVSLVSGRGSAETAGPFQVAVRMQPPPGSEAGQTVTQTMTLELRRTGGEQTVVASCAVTLWGFNRSERG